MKQFTILTTLLLSLLVATPVVSADFQKGMDAAKEGYYVAAFKEWQPLAEKGDAVSQ